MTEQSSINLWDSAAAIFAAAVTAADPADSLRRRLRTAPFPAPKQGGRSILIAVGKAAPAMMAEALQHVQGDHIALAVTHAENQTDVDGATVLNCAHPVPDERGLKAGRQIIALLKSAREEDQIIALISSGDRPWFPRLSRG